MATTTATATATRPSRSAKSTITTTTYKLKPVSFEQSRHTGATINVSTPIEIKSFEHSSVHPYASTSGEPVVEPKVPLSRSASSSSQAKVKPSFEYSYSYNYRHSPSSSPEPHVQLHPEEHQPKPRLGRSSSTALPNGIKPKLEERTFHGFSSTSTFNDGQLGSSPPKYPNGRSSSSTAAPRDRQRSPSPAPVPANAFNIMHEWEIESLEKWQRRLERVRHQQSDLRSKIAALVKEERALFNKYDRKQVAGDYAEWVAFLEEELEGMKKELEGTMEAEEKAEKGVRKASARLQEIRNLGGRWRTGVTAEEPPHTTSRSRSSSESSAGGPQPHEEKRSRSHSKPPPQAQTSRARSATPAPEQRRPTRPARSNTDPFPASRTPPPSTSAPKPTATRPPLSRSASPSNTFTPRGRPLQPSSQKSSLNPWLAYEDKWHQLLTNPGTLSLTFKSIPWPMAIPPTCPEDIKVTSIKSFVLSSNAVHLHPHPVVVATTEMGEQQQQVRQKRAVLRAAILRWHPDKFLTKYLGMVKEDEREIVKEGVEMVIRGLNEIMRMEAAKERSV